MDNLKERFFAQYWGVECAYFGFCLSPVKVKASIFDSIEYLELKHWKSMDREDMRIRNQIWNEELEHREIFVTEFLRSRGYLVPFMGMSEDDLIEEGWVKIIE